MSNYPEQPQQSPYGQGHSYYVQPQQPQSGAPPAPPDSVAPQQQRKKRRRWPWIVLSIVVVLAAGIFALVNFISHNPATDLANQYYTAIKKQDYATAYRYLAPNMTTSPDNQPLTQDLFTQAGQGLDTTKGQVTKYTITSTSLNSNNGVNTADFTVNVTRNYGSYDVHLHLQQQGTDWKILSFDNI